MKRLIFIIAVALAIALPLTSSHAAPLVAPCLMTTISGNQVTASWTAVPDAIGYIVYFAPPDQTGQPDLTQVGSFSWNGTQVGPVTVPSGFSLYLAVQGVTASGGGMLSNIGFLFAQTRPCSCRQREGPGGK